MHRVPVEPDRGAVPRGQRHLPARLSFPLHFAVAAQARGLPIGLSRLGVQELIGFGFIHISN